MLPCGNWGLKRFPLGRGCCVEPAGPTLAQKHRNGSLRLQGHCQLVKWLHSAGPWIGKACVPHFVDVEKRQGEVTQRQSGNNGALVTF